MTNLTKKDLLLHFSISVSKDNLSYIKQIMKKGAIFAEEGVDSKDIEIGEVIEIRNRITEGDNSGLEDLIATMILFNQHLTDDKPYMSLENSI